MYPFIPARYFTNVVRTEVDLVVIHDMEAPEVAKTARNTAAYFQQVMPKGRECSAHYCVDAQEAIQCVHEYQIAWHAPGCNHNGIGVEHAGYANQTAEQWLDPYSASMLRLSANLVAQICKRWAIPLVFVDAAALQIGRRGITTHAEVTKAFHKGDHWDPGPTFPMGQYLAWVNEAAA